MTAANYIVTVFGEYDLTSLATSLAAPVIECTKCTYSRFVPWGRQDLKCGELSMSRPACAQIKKNFFRPMSNQAKLGFGCELPRDWGSWPEIWWFLPIVNILAISAFA
jgi:hypothetical protein